MMSIIPTNVAYGLWILFTIIGTFFVVINPISPKLEKQLQVIANIFMIIGYLAMIFGYPSLNDAIGDSASLFWIASWIVGYRIRKHRKNNLFN